jgi:hypothetical protein
MQSIADYTIISASPFTLQVGGDIDRDFTFSIPSTVSLTSSAILGFMVTTNGADNLKVHVSINGVQVFSYGPSDTNITRFFQKVVTAPHAGGYGAGQSTQSMAGWWPWRGRSPLWCARARI